MRIWIDPARCDYCGTCVAVCPEDAIELERAFIEVNRDVCTLCRRCVDVCPLKVPEVEDEIPV
jgi:ferredoxin